MPKRTSGTLSAVPSGQAETADDAQAAFDFGDPPPGIPEHVDESRDWVTDPRGAVRQWMADTKKNSGKSFNERSVTQYVAMVGAVCDHWRTLDKPVTLLSARVSELECFLRKPNARGQVSSESTQRRYLGLLQSVFDHLVDAGLRGTNPAREMLQVPAISIVERAEPTFLAPEQMSQLQTTLLDTTADGDWLEVRNRALLGAFAGAGITTAEAQSLSLDNVKTHRAEITLYIDHRVARRRRSVALAAWATPLMLEWLRVRREIAPKLNLRDADGPLFPASYKGSENAVDAVNSTRPARALSDTETYVIVADVMARISSSSAQLGPQTLRNSYATSRLLSGAKEARLMTDLGLETTFTLDVLRKQLIDKGLLDPKQRT